MISHRWIVAIVLSVFAVQAIAAYQSFQHAQALLQHRIQAIEAIKP